MSPIELASGRKGSRCSQRAFEILNTPPPSDNVDVARIQAEARRDRPYLGRYVGNKI